MIPSFNGQNTVTPIALKKPTTVKLPSFANGKIALALSQNKDVLERDHSSSLPNSIYPKSEDNISELTDKIAKVKVDSSKYKR